MAKIKTIIAHNKNASRSYLLSKLLVFRIAKYSVMLITFFVMFMLIKDTTRAEDLSSWLTLGGNGMLLVVFALSSGNISKLILDSLNKSRMNLLYVVALLIFGLYLVFEERGKVIENPDDYISIIYFTLFPMGITILKHVISVVVNGRISPLVAKTEMYKLAGSLFITASLIMGYILIYFMGISETHVYQYDGKYERIIYTLLPFTILFGIGAQFQGYIKNSKLEFRAGNKDKVKVVFVPIYLSVGLGFLIETFTMTSSSPIIIYIFVITFVSIFIFTYALIAKGEIASSNIATTIYGIALVIVGMLPFLYVSIYGYRYNMYTLINLSSIGTCVIFISMAIADSAFSRAQSYAFALVVALLSATLFGYGFIQSFDFDPSQLPLDLDSALLITFALVPTAFLQTGMGKIFIRQSSMGHGVRIEAKLKVKEKEVIHE